MKLIDTHCHLCHGRLRNQLDAVLDRGRAAGVAAFVCAAGNLGESQAALKIAQHNEDVYCLAGVHPHDAKDAEADYLERLQELAADGKNVGIGEIGLDYHYNFSPPADQRRVFAEQLALAERLDKPAIIHTREAFDDTLAIINDCARWPSLLFHSFTGDADQARQVLDLGATISLSGIVTFNSAAEIREAAKLVPDDRLLVETDAPYLSPEPVRKIRTNEPAHVCHIVTFLAELRNTSGEFLAETTTANATVFLGF